MASKPSAFFGGSRGVFIPRFQFNGNTGAYTYVTGGGGERDPNTGKLKVRTIPVPLGTKIAIDFGAFWRGWNIFNPRYAEVFAPMHHDIPPQPAAVDGQEYTQAIRTQVLLPQLGLAQFTIGGNIAQNAIYTLYMLFEAAAEAAAGKISVYILRPCQQVPVASRSGELHKVPVFEQIDWI